MTEHVVPLFNDRDANLPEARLDVSHLRSSGAGQAVRSRRST